MQREENIVSRVFHLCSLFFFVSNASLFPCISASPSEKLLDAKGYMESPVMCSPSLCRASSIAMEDEMPFMFLSSTKSTGLSSWCGLWFIKLNPSRNSTFPVKFILPIKPSIIHAIAPGERGCSILGSLIPRFSMRRRSLVTDFLSRALNFLLQPPISLASSFLKNLAWS